MMRPIQGCFVLGSLVSLCLFPAEAPAADSPADFYKGKQIKLYVGSDVGGIYDTYARIMSEYWPRHIPGKPTMVVQNMPGATGRKVTNFIFSGAPRDGTVVGSAQGQIPTAPLLAPEGVQFDSNKLSWLGNISSETFIGFVWHTSPIHDMEDAKRVQSIMGAPDASAASAIFAAISNEFFGTKFKIVKGYVGAPQRSTVQSEPAGRR
jgi:tripartite-type tricarboxylate transporter receptor subunit TctC